MAAHPAHGLVWVLRPVLAEAWRLNDLHPASPLLSSPSSLVLLLSRPGILLVRLGLLPPLIVLPVSVQLDRQPAGILLPAAAGNPRFCHHDPSGHGGTSEEGESGGM